MSDKKTIGETESSDGKIKIYPCDAEFRKRFLTWRAVNPKFDHRAIARGIGRSSAVVDRYSHPSGCAYAGDISTIERKLAEFMRDAELRLDSNIETIDCEIAAQIETAIEEIRTAKRIGVILGEPGIGKSRGINLYCREHELAVVFRVCAWLKSQSDFAECLFKAADVSQPKRGLAGMKTLVEKMTGSARPFLIDDAHKLTRAALQLAYDFRDATGSPFALFGDERLVTKLKDDAQRLRRTGIVFKLKIKNPRPLVEHHVDALALDVNGERKDLVDLCLNIAAGAGHFGSVQMELSLAARLKIGNPDWNWCEAVKRAHKKLIRDYELN